MAGRTADWAYRRGIRKWLRVLAQAGVTVIVPPYQAYRWLSRRLFANVPLSDSRWWDVITHRYSTHVIVCVVGLFVVVNNIQAQVVARDEDFGKTSILYALAGGDELTYIEETGVAADRSAATTNVLRGDAGMSSLGTDQYAVESSAVVQGGTALVRPEISPSSDSGVASVRSEVEPYIVQPGDTIGSVAERFGISVNTILWENNLTERSTIRPGDTLRILPLSGVKHKVKRGETLARIAQLYGLAAEAIIAENDLIDEDALRIGDELVIPGGKKLATVVPKPVTRASPRSYVGGVPTAATTDAGTRLLWPTPARRVTQYFGWRHTGVDIASRESPPVYAAEAGTVIRASGSGSWNGGYGNIIIIDHGNGLQTLYGHLKTLSVSVGDIVTRGQGIAIMGNTGRSTGPHVHFEVRVGGKRVNPFTYIK